MKDDDRDDGAASDLASAPPGERERAIREACERIAAAQRAEPQRRDAPPPAPARAGPTLQSPAWVAPPDGAAPGPPPASLPPVAELPAFLKVTAPLPPEIRGALPLRPAPAPQPPKRVSPPTVQSRVMGLGGTAGVFDDAIQKAVAASGALPRLTMRQFASLCAELAFYPKERRREILERYTVRDEPTFAALDAYWRGERAARPEARTAFTDDYASHLAWLHKHRA